VSTVDPAPRIRHEQIENAVDATLMQIGGSLFSDTAQFFNLAKVQISKSNGPGCYLSISACCHNVYSTPNK
jgi:hypothetical protein